MGEIVVKVVVPDGEEIEFKEIIEEIAEFYNRRNRILKILDELRGMLNTTKSWNELEAEIHEQGIH